MMQELAELVDNRTFNPDDEPIQNWEVFNPQNRHIWATLDNKADAKLLAEYIGMNYALEGEEYV